MNSKALAPEIAAVLAAFRDALEVRFGARVREMRLFGSWARGDARADSDVDVLVVVDDLERRERNEIYGLAADLYEGFSRRVSPLALSPEDYVTLRDREYLIAAEIAREGIAV